jgi:hypothetical protein
LSPAEAAKLLSMYQDSVWACMHDGLLDYSWHGAQGAAITEKAIKKFRKTYVTSSEFAASLKSIPRYVMPLLEECGVKPVAHRSEKSRLRVAIYRRADIPADFTERYRQRFRAAQ